MWSVNSVGRTPSSWSSCRTGPAPPEGLGAPLFNTVASTVAVVSISPPLKPNGVVSIYRLFSNGTRGTDVVVSIVNTFSLLPLVFSSFNNFVITSCCCWSQTAFLSWPPIVSCSAMHCPVRELKLSTDFTLPIYSFQCTWLCLCLIQPAHPIGACMAFHFHSLTPAMLLARLWLWLWHQEVPSASLCLLDSLLLIFC